MDNVLKTLGLVWVDAVLGMKSDVITLQDPKRLPVHKQCATHTDPTLLLDWFVVQTSVYCSRVTVQPFHISIY